MSLQATHKFTKPTKSLSDDCQFKVVHLNTFLNEYYEEICDYYGIDYYDDINLSDDKIAVLCLVDVSETKIHTMKYDVRKKMRKAGKIRRDKMKDKYYYHNPFNRIHSYALLENSSKKDKTMCLNVICTSNYSDQKGLGSFLLQQVITYAKKTGFNNLILEVGNNEVTTREDDMEDGESAEEDEEWAEDEEEEEEESDDYDDLIEIVADQLWKKTVRHDPYGPHYLIDEDYIKDIIYDYIYDEETEHEDFEVPTDDIYGYGGYYYKKGKNSCERLMGFYEKYGFVEDSKVNTEWKCFGELPLPSMILQL